METETSSEERKEDEGLSVVVSRLHLSDATEALLSHEDISYVVGEHLKDGEWVHPTGAARAVCTITQTTRGVRILSMTMPCRTSTSLFIVDEIVCLLKSYTERCAKGPRDQVSRVGLFQIGHVVLSEGANDVLTDEDIAIALFRHLAGDWGDVDEVDWKMNVYSLHHSQRLTSSYRSAAGRKFFVSTGAGRSRTILHLPGEFRDGVRGGAGGDGEGRKNALRC